MRSIHFRSLLAITGLLLIAAFAGAPSPVAHALSPVTPPALPFAPGVQIKVSQGPNNSYSHTGAYNWSAVDFEASPGIPVYAAQTGSVYFEGWSINSSIRDGSAGIQILLDLGNDNCIQYAHLSSTVIDRGDRVLRGQLLGYTGSTGKADGPHLHWAGVSCGAQTAKFIPSTVEYGTTYPVGSTRASQNNGADLQNPQANRCVDVSGASTANGAWVQLWDCNGTVAQRWTYNTSTRTLKVFGGARCLDVTGGNLWAGTKV